MRGDAEYVKENAEEESKSGMIDDDAFDDRNDVQAGNMHPPVQLPNKEPFQLSKIANSSASGDPPPIRPMNHVVVVNWLLVIF